MKYRLTAPVIVLVSLALLGCPEVTIEPAPIEITQAETSFAAAADAEFELGCTDTQSSGNGFGTSCEGGTDACNKADKKAKKECNDACEAYECADDQICHIKDVPTGGCVGEAKVHQGKCPPAQEGGDRQPGWTCARACICNCGCT